MIPMGLLQCERIERAVAVSVGSKLVQGRILQLETQRPRTGPPQDDRHQRGKILEKASVSISEAFENASCDLGWPSSSSIIKRVGLDLLTRPLVSTRSPSLDDLADINKMFLRVSPINIHIYVIRLQKGFRIEG